MASITKRGNKWLVQVRRQGFPAASRSFESHAAAKEWAADQEARVRAGEKPVSRRELSGVALAEIFDRYLLEVTPTKRSVETERIRLGAFKRDPIALVRLDRLRTSHFASYRDRRLMLVSAATVRRELAIMGHALEVARREWNYALPCNPVSAVRQPAVSNARVRRLSAGEEARLEAAMEQSRNKLLRSIVRLALETGMRRGEILNLSWQHVDLSRNIAHIPQTKTGKPRTIPLTPKAADILSGQPRPSRAALVFPLTANALRLAWERAVRRAKIDDLHFHDLRHEALSRFFELGLSVPEVAAISGHRDIRMLMRYAHMQPLALAQKLAAQPWVRPGILVANAPPSQPCE